MNIINKIKQTLSAIALISLVFAPNIASAETLNKEGEWSKTVTVKKGQAHTFWVKNETSDQSLSVSVEITYKYKEDGETYDDVIYPFESTDVENSNGGYDHYVLLTVDDWADVPDNATSIKCVVYVSGWYDEETAANNKFTFDSKTGDSEYPGEPEPVVVDPKGTETNPVTFSIAEANTVQNPGSVDWDQDENWEGGSVYLNTSSLVAGRKYVFGFDGVATNATITMTLKSGGENLFTAENASTLFDNCTNFCWAVIPDEGGVYEIVVDDDSNAFTCNYAVYAKRTPPQHEGVDYGDGDPDAHFGYLAVDETSEEFAPGYLNHPNSGANDDVIDGKLFVLSDLVKNTDYCFATEGASVPLMMRLYDAKGTILAENNYVSDSDCNLRICWTSPANLTASTKYYVGVCEQLEKDASPSGNKITLSLKEVEVDEIEENLVVVPTTEDVSPFDVEDAKPSAAQTFSQTSWTHTYVIAARKGVEYHVKARLTAGDSDNGLTLAAKVCTLSGAQYKEVNQTQWKVDGEIDPKAEGYLSFVPTANGTVYIEVSIDDNEEEWGSGLGLDYGPYQVCAVASGEYGVLTVNMKGASEDLMGWKILKTNGKATSGEVFYPAGASAILAAGQYTLIAQTVNSFAKPNANGFTNVTVAVGKTAIAEYKYTDTFDPKDDYVAGKKGTVTYTPTKISPSAKGVESVRSLWSDDTADWFSFTATEGAYYKFELTEKTGNPVMCVYAVKTGVKKVEDEDDLDECEYSIFTDKSACVQIAAKVKGTYYVKVAHANEESPVDSAYTMFATSANPGVVKFAKTDVSVRDSAGYVDLSVSRTGREGITRVTYKTVGVSTNAENALYYPTSGTLTWGNGDNKAKTIRVKIVPQDYGKGGTFQVELAAIDPEDESFDKENEFPAVIANDTANITVTVTAKAAPGTIQLADCDTPKKPVVNVTAGEQVWLQLERVSGSDGLVGVTCEPVKGKALPGVDYTAFSAEVLEWTNTESGTNAIPIPIQTWAVENDYTATKSFTIKLTAKTGKSPSGESYAKPTLAATTITINIQNDKFASTVAAYATALKKTTPSIAMKESKTGTWFVTADGSMFSSAETGTLTFTLTGPGVFTYKLDGEEEKNLFVAYGDNKNNKVVIDAGDTLLYYKWEPLPDNLATLRQCVKHTQLFTNEESKVTMKGKLPDGLKLAQDKTTKVWSVSGTPTKAGYFQAIFTETRCCGIVVTETNNYNVVAAGTAIGTFSGLAYTTEVDDGLRSLASVTLTAAATGKLTGKVLIGGKTYQFADTGYSSFDNYDDYAIVNAEIPLIQKVTEKDGTKTVSTTVTNWLYCTVTDASETNAVARNAKVECHIEFEKLPTTKANEYTDDVWYDGSLCRDNSKVTDWVAEAAKFAGYYTVSLVNDCANDGEPKGNGYLTLTFDAKGKVKIAGMLADGTAYSASSISANLVEYFGATAISVPLYACKGTYVFGGWLMIVPTEDGALVATADERLIWANDALTSTREGEEGFNLEIMPVGGWYDTVRNLQKWFLEYDFSVDLPSWDDDFESLLPAGYESYAFAANPCGQAVDVYGDTVSVVKQSLVKDATTKLYDWSNSVNASNVKITFKRATGIVSGTFDLWYEGTNEKTGKFEQKTLSNLKHNGVLLLSRDESGLLDDDVWTSGFYLVPKVGGTKWTGSYRFDIKAKYVDREWESGIEE